MPDFTLETYRVCGTTLDDRKLIDSSDKSKQYVLDWFGQQWHCNCPGFQHRGKCKHTEQAEATRCAFGEKSFAGDGQEPELEDAEYCPKCGQKTTIVRVAV